MLTMLCMKMCVCLQVYYMPSSAGGFVEIIDSQEEGGLMVTELESHELARLLEDSSSTPGGAAAPQGTKEQDRRLAASAPEGVQGSGNRRAHAQKPGEGVERFAAGISQGSLTR
jgi:hypothetical protein